MRPSRWFLLIAIALISTGLSAHADDRADMIRLINTIKFLNTPGPHCDYPWKPAPPKVDDAACDAHLNAWLEAMTIAKPVDDMVEKLKAKSPQMILIGEDHYASSVNYNPTLIHKLKAAMPELDCLFLEFSPQAKMNIQAMQDGKNSLVRDNRVFEAKPIIEAANKEGIKIILADKNSRTPGWEWIHGMWIDVNANLDMNIVDRNTGFTEAISSRFQDKSCRHGALIIGKSHITEQLGHYKTLPQMLKEMKISTSAITMISTADGFFGHLDQYSWSNCQRNLAPPSQAVAFPIEGAMTEREDSRQFGGRMGDFDFALVAPPDPYKLQLPADYQQH